MVAGYMACVGWWTATGAWANPGVVLLQQGGSLTHSEADFSTELALAAPDLDVILVPVDPGFAQESATDQASIASGWVQSYQVDAAVWLRENAVSIWWPAGDRAVTVAVEASTDQPHTELALVVVAQLSQAHLYEPAVAQAVEAIDPEPEIDGTPQKWTMAVMGQVEGNWAAKSGPRIGLGWLAERNLSRVRLGVSGGQRWGRSQRQNVTAIVASHVDLRTAYVFGQAVQWGPSLAIRGAQNQVSIQVSADRPDRTTGALNLQAVPGARIEVGATTVRALLLFEVPLATRREIWRVDGDEVFAFGRAFWTLSSGASWRF